MSIVGVWRRYLQVRVLSLIVAILVVGFGVLGIWNIRTQAAAVLEQRKEASRSLADAIVQSIESSMLAGRPDIVRALSQRLHTLKDVEQITIFRTNGVEAFTDLATLEEVQQGLPSLLKWSTRSGACRRSLRGACTTHSSSRPLTAGRRRNSSKQ